MREAEAFRKLASDLRAEADRRDAYRKVQNVRVVTAAAGLAALHNLVGASK